MVLDTNDALVTPQGRMQLDQEALKKYLSKFIDEIAQTPSLQAFQFSHGQSNPTYLLKTPHATFVLRKKPPPPTLPSAHAIEREFHVIQALNATPVPVPRAIHLCEDPSIIGTPFYIMEHIKGTIFDSPSLPNLSPMQRSRIYKAMASTLASLHNIIPQNIGLGKYGPPTGYNQRQVHRWSTQYKKSLSSSPTEHDEMIQLGRALQSRIPHHRDSDPSVMRICHGDFRLDNLVYDPNTTQSTVLAVLDWELSTVGDPLADVAYNCLPYYLPSDMDLPSLISFPSPLPPGIPTEQEYIEMYCHARNMPSISSLVTKEEWSFYVALSLFRLASILAGVGARAQQGNASSRVAAQMGADHVVKGLARVALNVLLFNDKFNRNDYSTKRMEAIKGTSSAPNNKDLILLSSSSNNNTSLIDSTPTNNYDMMKMNTTTTTTTTTTTSPVLGLDPSPSLRPLLSQLNDFMNQCIYPSESILHAHAASKDRWTIHPLQEELKKKARKLGLWNLWIPRDMAHAIRVSLGDELSSLSLKERENLLGKQLTNLEYAHCAEIMGHSVWAPEVFNCSAPDTGNMEVLARYGNKEQQKKWLLPLLQGHIRSCFAMTEPGVASSDATNIESRIQATHASTSEEKTAGKRYTIHGHKWWISGANDPRCALAIFMGKTDPMASPHRQQSMILVPMDTPGITIVRPLTVFGYDDAPHGHAEIIFENVEVDGANLILGEGRGFEIAQGRLGPGRLHHCMRLLGMGERAVSEMVRRSTSRVAFKTNLAGHQSVRNDIAKSRVELNAARLLVLHAAHMLDVSGNKRAKGDIAAAKVMTPSTVLAVLDRAIQMHGGAGVSDVTPLAGMWAAARTLRLADGPDIVHLETIAKIELNSVVHRQNDDAITGGDNVRRRARL